MVLRFKLNGVALSDRLTRFLAYKTLLKRPITRPQLKCLSVEIKGATENGTGLPNYIVTCNKRLDNGTDNPLTTRRYGEIPGNQKLPARYEAKIMCVKCVPKCQLENKCA